MGSLAPSTTSRLILRPITDVLTSTSTAIATTSLAVPKAKKPSGSLGVAVIAGVTIGCLIAVGIIALVLVECFIRKRWTLLRRGSASTATTGNVTMMTGIYGGSSESTTAVGSHENDMRRMSQLSKGSGGSGRSTKIRFEDQV